MFVPCALKAGIQWVREAVRISAKTTGTRIARLVRRLAKRRVTRALVPNTFSVNTLAVTVGLATI